ncbi:MAG: methionine adenosyltransferase [Alphaproteobacteria bacterium]
MPRDAYLFTSESVSEGHPDKICDRISDAIVDTYLTVDPQARVAAETMVTTNRILIAGEVRTSAKMMPERLEEVARSCVREIGYEQETFHWAKAQLALYLHEQSHEIALGVDARGNKQEGAGDQGMMFGYACGETDVYMPAPIYYAHSILRSLAEARRSGAEPGLGPDGKSQVTLHYVNGTPVRAVSVVVSTQHREGLSQEEVRDIVRPYVRNVLPEGWMCDEENFYVNPTGSFVSGGPHADCGLTGRKIIVDTYGGAAPHGGGAFSGKDPSKVDRAGAYAARYLAKNVVAAGLAARCTVRLAYAIGVARPLMVDVDTHCTGRVDEDRLEKALREVMDLSPRGIRDHLGLDRPIYARTAAYGHFGRDPEADGGFSWERLDLVDELTAAFG